MQFGLIIASLYRNKVGAVLIALQITLTLVILCNALFIVRQKLSQMQRPSGLDEANIFIIDNRFIGGSEDSIPRVRADLDALRAIPGAAGAYLSNSYPFQLGGMDGGFSLHPDLKEAVDAGIYFGDEQTLHTLDLRLIAGRNFYPDEVVKFNASTLKKFPPTNGIIVSRAVADRLAPGGQLLGKRLMMFPVSQSATVVGIIDKLQSPWAALASSSSDIADSELSVIQPYLFTQGGGYYIVRAQAGRVSAVMKAARETLLAISRQRAIGNVETLAEARHAAEGSNRVPAVMLTLVSASLLAVTAFGIVGLASFWVTQRRRQIGIRRALGATRIAIVRHFQVENLLITLAGTTVGAALAVAANLYLVSTSAMERLPVSYLVTGVATMLLLGQLAVLAPALRGASVPPAIAARAG